MRPYEYEERQVSHDVHWNTGENRICQIGYQSERYADQEVHSQLGQKPSVRTMRQHEKERGDADCKRSVEFLLQNLLAVTAKSNLFCDGRNQRTHHENQGDG